MTFLNIEWVIKRFPNFVFNFIRIGNIGSLLYFYIDHNGFDLDILFLKKPILWVIGKIKELFGGK